MKARKALTLLELIIALLVVVGLVLLVAPMARENRRQTACRSNLRQMGLAMTMYANDYGGWTPSIEPEARRIANAAGLPAGCVLTFKDKDGIYKSSGLGRLQEGGYVVRFGVAAFYCPSTHGDDETWVMAFSPDEDEGFWQTGKPGPTDGDGVGELPGNADVMLSGYVLRFNTENEWGALSTAEPYYPVASDLVVFRDRSVSVSHRSVFNVLYMDGSVKTHEDTQDVIASLCQGVSADEIEDTLDRRIYRQYWDPLINWD